MLLGSFLRLADRIGNFVGLAVAVADFAVSVTDDDESAEGEVAAAFHNLGAAVDAEDELFHLAGGSGCRLNGREVDFLDIGFLFDILFFDCHVQLH